MRRFFLFSTISIIFLFALNIGSQEIVLKKLKDNFYAVTGGGGNSAFLVTDEGVVLIDSKTSPSIGEELIKKVGEITDKKIKFLIFTHYHGDHTQGAQSFEPSAISISHLNTRKNIEKINIPRIEDAKKSLPNQIESAKKKIEDLKAKKSPEVSKAEEELQSLMRRLGNIENLKLILPEIAIENRASIFIGGKEIVLIYKGRAHTDGDLLVYFPSEKAIHTGDIVFNRIIPYIDYQGGSSTENWIKILEEIEKMDVEIVIPGHGEIGDKSILRAQAEYLRALREEVKKFVEKGFTLEDTIKNASLPRYKDMEGYSQRFSRNVEAVYRELKDIR